MELKRVLSFEEKEVNALIAVANINCDCIECSECPMVVKGKCVRGLVRQILVKQNIDYLGGE